ncbi:MAG: HNH endonuclease [Methanobrevibacter sp.]|nr:HNH endonuclease [Methanobrevibacter sp.]
MEKYIPNFENYTINDSGNNNAMVYNTLRKKFKKPQQYPSGYLFVSLYQNGKNKMFLLHRLVAEAFIPNPENRPCVGHYDCNRTNNNVENLYWCTQQENMNNPITIKNISETRKGMKFSDEHKKHLKEKAKANYKKRERNEKGQFK